MVAIVLCSRTLWMTCRCRCTDDVLQLGDCDEAAVDKWYYYESGDFSGSALDPNNDFMACWETGAGWQGPYLADGEPLRKTPFQASVSEIGCDWSKVRVYIRLMFFF